MQTIQTKDFITNYQTGSINIIDVREQYEWDMIHMKNTKHIPLSAFSLVDIDKTRPVYILCRSGSRSAQITAYLSQLGYNAINIIGGIKEVYVQNKEICTTSPMFTYSFLG